VEISLQPLVSSRFLPLVARIRLSMLLENILKLLESEELPPKAAE
jgi:hypothetical protein